MATDCDDAFLPAGQAWQVALLVPDPAGHGVQPAPESSLYLPTGHVPQVGRLKAPALLPVPALQALVHGVDLCLESDHFPGAQGWQVLLPVLVSLPFLNC